MRHTTCHATCDASRDVSCDAEECDASEMTSVNLLADLVQRFHAEQDALISALRRPASSPQQRWLPLVLLKLDSERVEMEQLFDVAALGVGLLERLAAPQARYRLQSEAVSGGQH